MREKGLAVDALLYGRRPTTETAARRLHANHWLFHVFDWSRVCSLTAARCSLRHHTRTRRGPHTARRWISGGQSESRHRRSSSVTIPPLNISCNKATNPLSVGGPGFPLLFIYALLAYSLEDPLAAPEWLMRIIEDLIWRLMDGKCAVLTYLCIWTIQGQ